MEIRPLAPSDLDAVLALNNANVPAVNELDAPEIARLATLTSVSLVAEIDGAVAGFCLVMPPVVDYASSNYTWFGAHAGELGYGSWAYLDRIAVADDARRHGVGRALYAEVLTRLRGTSPVLFCEVNVRPRNDPSLAFHASLGFREVGQQDTDGGAKTVSLLALDLD
jgi:predicted GNAT superfamily acetyltransferase